MPRNTPRDEWTDELLQAAERLRAGSATPADRGLVLESARQAEILLTAVEGEPDPELAASEAASALASRLRSRLASLRVLSAGPEERRDTQAEWASWAAGEFGLDGDHLSEAGALAFAALGSPAGQRVAAAALRLRFGRRLAEDVELVRWEVDRLRWVSTQLGSEALGGGLTRRGLGALAAAQSRRADLLAGLLAPAQAAVAPARTAAAPAGRATLADPVQPAPRPSLREFFAERSILVVSYTGAFLLIVATLLFELYGTNLFSGSTKFLAVALLNAVFAVAGAMCLNSARLRIVGHTYVAIAALMLPLVIAAAYYFLGLGAAGVPVELAIALGALSCAAVYLALAVALQLPLYAVLAYLALPLGGAAALDLAGAGRWTPLGLTPLVLIYAWLALRSDRIAGLSDVLARHADWFVHVAAGLVLAELVFWASWPNPYSWAALLACAGLAGAYAAYALLGGRRFGDWLVSAFAGAAWLILAELLVPAPWRGAAVAVLAIAYAGLEARGGRLSTTAGVSLWVASGFAGVVALWPALPVLDVTGTAAGGAAALEVLAAANALRWRLLARPLAIAPAAALFSVAILLENAALGWGLRGAAMELLGLAAAYAVGAERTRHRLLRRLLLGGLLVQGLAALAPFASPSWLEAVEVGGVLGLFAAAARRTRRPAWLLPAGVALFWLWQWVPAVFLPAPADAVRALLYLYTPLPVVFAAGGIVLRVGLGREWAWPGYLLAAALGAAVVVACYADRLEALAASAVLAYAVCVYVAGTLDRQRAAVAAAGVLLAGGVLGALHAGAAGLEWYAPAALSTALAVYALGWAWEQLSGRGRWTETHRMVGVGGASLAATAATLALPTAAGPMAVSGLLVVVGFAALLLLDARRSGVPDLEYAALLAAAAASGWLARWLGSTQVQLYTTPVAVALLVVGLRLPHERRLLRRPRLEAALVYAGLALALGVTVLQSLTEPGREWLFTAVLLLESVAVLMVGIGLRNQRLLAASGAGAALAALRGFLLFVQAVPLFVVFGLVALLLLAAGAALAVGRERFRELRLALEGSLPQPGAPEEPAAAPAAGLPPGRLLAAVLPVVGTLLMTVAAFTPAASGPPGGFEVPGRGQGTITASPVTGSSGDRGVIVRADGLPPFTSVRLLMDGRVMSSTMSDSNGRLPGWSFAVPPGTTGIHTVDLCWDFKGGQVCTQPAKVGV